MDKTYSYILYRYNSLSEKVVKGLDKNIYYLQYNNILHCINGILYCHYDDQLIRLTLSVDKVLNECEDGTFTQL